MQRHMWRAFMLAIAILLLGALPAVAQTADDDGLFLTNESGSVVIGLSEDVAVSAGTAANGVLVVDGTALIEGTVDGLVGIDSDVVVTGTGASVEGIFMTGGSLVVEGGATVSDLAIAGTDVTGVTEGSVTGELYDIEQDLLNGLAWIAAAVVIFLFFLWIGAGLAMLFSSLLAVAFGTSQLRRSAANIGGDVLKTFVVGLLMIFVPWIVIALLAITIVGLPLAIMLGMLWTFVAFVGYLTVGLWIGQRILSRSRTAARPYGAAFLGTLILMLLSWVPLVTPFAVLFGVGAVSLAAWRVLRSGGQPPVPPGYGGQWGQPQPMAPPSYAPPPYAPPPYAPPPQPGGYPPQPGGYPPEQGGYPPEQGGYPPEQGGYPPEQGGPTNWPQG